MEWREHLFFKELSSSNSQEYLKDRLRFQLSLLMSRLSLPLQNLLIINLRENGMHAQCAKRTGSQFARSAQPDAVPPYSLNDVGERRKSFSDC